MQAVLSQMSRGRVLRRGASGVVIVLMAITLVACGSSSSSTTTSGSGGSGSAASGSGGSGTAASGLKVMVISSNNSQYYNYPDIWTVADAYAKSANASGGFGGRKVQIIDCNDQGNPNLAVKCAREAVSDHVVALVGGITVYAQQIFQILAGSGIPWVGNPAITPGDFTNKLSYPTEPQALNYVAMGDAIAKQCKSGAAVHLDAAADTGLMNFGIEGMAANGKKFTTISKIEPTATDLTPNVTQLTSSGAPCLYFQLPVQVSQAFVKAMQQTGAKMRIYGAPGTTTPAVISAAPSVMEGAIIASSNPAPSSPLWNAASSALSKYEGKSSVSALEGANEANTWVAFKVFDDVLSHIKGSVTSSAIISQLGKTTNETAGGLIGRTDYSKPSSIPGYPRLMNHYATYWVVKNGKFVQQTNGFVDMGSVLSKGLVNK